MLRSLSVRSSDICKIRTGLAAVALILGLAAGRAGAGDVVYMESNQASGNAVMAFRRGADGSLTPLKGSPFKTGGLGVSPSLMLGPYDSDSEIIVNEDKSLLFAVNGGSDSIAAFRIGADGGLTAVPGSPFPSGGSNPVSLAIRGDTLMVVNKDQDPGHPGVDLPNYTTCRVTRTGRLVHLPWSTVTVDAGSSPSQALIAPGGRIAFGNDFMGGLVRSFSLSNHGYLSARDAKPIPPAEYGASGAPPFPLGLAVHPESSKPFLYVGLVTINRMGIFRYHPNGRLQYVRSVEDSGKGICWIVANKAGTRLYTSNTGDNSISVYDLTDPAEPVEIQHLVLKGPGEVYQIALDGANKHFYAVTQRNAATEPIQSNALHVLTVAADGKLAEVASSPTVFPFTDGTRPQGVVAP